MFRMSQIANLSITDSAVQIMNYQYAPSISSSISNCNARKFSSVGVNLGVFRHSEEDVVREIIGDNVSGVRAQL